MIDPQKLNRQRDFETTQLATAVYNALAAGESAAKVQQDLIYKGVDESTAVYIVSHIYQKKRWQITWYRTGVGLKLVFSGGFSLLIAGFVLLSGLAVVRQISTLYPDFNRVLFSIILFTAGFLAISGVLSLGLGTFRLLTASSDNMAGCLAAILIGLILLLAALLAYLLLPLLPRTFS